MWSFIYTGQQLAANGTHAYSSPVRLVDIPP